MSNLEGAILNTANPFNVSSMTIGDHPDEDHLERKDQTEAAAYNPKKSFNRSHPMTPRVCDGCRVLMEQGDLNLDNGVDKRGEHRVNIPLIYEMCSVTARQILY